MPINWSSFRASSSVLAVVTSAKTDEEARKLLQLMGVPFRAN